MTENRSYNTKSRKYILEFLKQNCDTTVAVSDILDYLIGEGYYFDTLENCPEYTTAE